MGVHKHGKESAKAKACKKYKDEGRLILNKKAVQEKLERLKEEGKKPKGKKKPLSRWHMMDNMIKCAKKSVPYCDPQVGVIWGTNKEDGRDAALKYQKKRYEKKSTTV